MIEVPAAIEENGLKASQAEKQGDLERAAQLRYGTLSELQKKLEAAKQRLEKQQGGRPMLKEEVDEEDVAAIVSRWTGIPVTRLVEGERDKLLRLDEILHQRVVGQDEAVQLVADAVIRARSGPGL